MNKKILSLLQYLFFLGLGIFLVWWSLGRIPEKDWNDIKNAFLNANYWLAIPVIISLLLSHYSRAIRWKILMEPMGYKPRVGNTYLAVLIGYMANLAVPRLGEVLKCTILARYEKVPADKLVGTIVAERAFDVLCLAIVIAITFFTQVDIIGGYLQLKLNEIVQSKADQFSTSRIILLVIILLVLVAAAIFVFRKFSHVGFIKKIKTIMVGVWHGITSVRYLKNKGWFIFHTIFIWSMYLMSVRLGFLAMQETSGYGLKESLSVLTTGSLAMIVPTPGGSMGVYPIFVSETLVLYGLKESLGLAFGWLMWGVQFFQMLVSGFIAIILLPYLNKSKKNAQG
jgi:glycosyltransferase 2 family protein